MSVGFDVLIEGQALNDHGFVAFDTLGGIGLMTYGFLWAIDDIWATCDADVTTTWTDCT